MKKSVSVVLGVGFVALFVSMVDWKGAAHFLRVLAPSRVALYSALILIAYGIGCARYRLIVGNRYSWRKTGYLYFLSKTGGSLTPGRIGDFSPFLVETYRHKEVLLAILLDKIIEFYLLLFFGFIGFLALRNLPAPLPLALILLFSAVTLVFLSLNRNGFWKRLDDSAQRGGTVPPGLMKRLLMKFTGMAEKASFEIRRMGPRYYLLPALAVVSYCISLIAVMLLLKAFSITMSPFLIAETIAVSGLIMILSLVPSGLGISEVTLLLIVEQYGVAREPFAAYCLTTRFLNLALLFVPYLAFGFLNRKAKDEPPCESCS